MSRVYTATPWAKWSLLSKRVFLPRAELSPLYGVPERSPQLGFYYAVRLRDLVRKYAASAWALNVSDAPLARWVSGS